MNPSNQQFLHLIVILLIVGASFISWLAKKLKEQADKKRALQEMERRRLEALRTGKDPGAAVAAAPSGSPEELRLRELAARRQAQLQELRRRQQNRPQQGGGRPPIVILAPGSSGQGVPGAPGVPGVPGSGRPRQGAPRQPAGSKPPSQPQRRPDQPRPRPASRPASEAREDTGESTTHRLVQDVRTPTTSKPRQPAMVLGAPMNAQQWRRALMLREVLAPPPGLTGRDPEERMI